MSTSQGRPYAIFRRALERRNLLGDEATIDEGAMVAACLAALAGARHRNAALTLRAMAERATSRRRARGVA